MSTLVFIYPQNIEFPETFEAQKIAIFNPYEFAIHFHFQCTRPTAFLLSATEGEILAKHSLDISINLLDKTIVEEKFQVRISVASKGKKLGEKIIKVTLKSERTDEDQTAQGKSTNVDHFQELMQSGYENAKPIEYNKALKINKVPNEYFVYAALVICILILFVPHEDHSATHLFQISVNCKLVAAYILGIVTVFLIRN